MLMNEVEKLKYKNITHAFMIKNNNYKICKYKSKYSDTTFIVNILMLLIVFI